ncbi:sulfatase family protein [Eudoraea chungangensis]|uniref:sulfatase family protein n=1 Tax=Eudoraea chungangensis TaxID=1481905 RepID=UPI0023ED0B0F|nr:sulfatase [Eudoraea chungangensis]
MTTHTNTWFYYLLFILFSLVNIPIEAQDAQGEKPNFIIIFADDLGYGDLSSYGHPSIKTPYLDRMAEEGQKWTNFYVAASVCTPSRAAILTGRLPVRSGMASSKRRVLFPDSKGGLPASEITLAEHLKSAGYNTACIGKWHLGHKDAFLPTTHGFDYYFGIPYSNDMDRTSQLPYREYLMQADEKIKTEDFNVPLYRNTEIIERPVNQNTITKRYSEETINYIKEHKKSPFFVYLAHNLPHVPLFVSEEYKGKSARGLYGDIIEEIDAGVGDIMNFLEEEGLAENTILVFTSDNGPWLTFKEKGGSAGLLRAGKGTTWEGGMREPALFWGPGTIKPGLRHDLGSSMDLFVTFSKMAGLEVPTDREMDGVDISGTLLNGNPSTRKSILYYRGTEIYAVRIGKYKAHYITQGEYGEFGKREEHEPPILYNLDTDPSEQFELTGDYTDVLNEFDLILEQHNAKLVKGKDQLVERE